MIEMIIVFVSQLFMIYFRLLNVRAIQNHKVWKSVGLTGLVQTTWLIASALGIKGFLEGNYTVIISYILGGMLGAYFSFKTKI